MTKQLSTRDQRILDLLQRGESVAQTARLVGVSSRTVGRVRDANVGYKTPTKQTPTTGPVVKSYGATTQLSTNDLAPVDSIDSSAPTSNELHRLEREMFRIKDQNSKEYKKAAKAYEDFKNKVLKPEQVA
jgi:transposase-like protein